MCERNGGLACMTDLCRKLLFFFLSLCSVFSGGAQEVPFVCADRLCGKETRQPRRCKEKGGRERGRKGENSHPLFVTHSKGRSEG